jgi:UDP-N-acetylglucosamine 2-epimerase (non-hydrolysing)
MPKKLIFAVGTRAQLIKVAPVVVACETRGFSVVLLMTGQHHETMQDLIEEFGIKSPQMRIMREAEHSTILSLLRWLPSAYLGIKRTLGGLMSDNTSQVYVLVHGDTLSTLVAACAARRSGAAVVHLESGLSSGRLFDPFPEEMVRRLVFRMTDIAMCPSADAAERMRRLGHRDVLDTQGNSILDAVRLTGALAMTPADGDAYVLVSLHRFQNLYDSRRLRQLVDLVENLAQVRSVRFVLHPATRGRLLAEGYLDRLSACGGISLLPRMGYRDFIRLAAGADCVLTDGGSNQEELAALGIPTIVMRARTERQDGLGANALMEQDAPGGVLNYVLDGRAGKLRRAPLVLSEEGPSSKMARYLTEHA